MPIFSEELARSHENLERQVEARTEGLRRLAAELSLTEARERRELAADLHDSIIQQFAFIRLRIHQFRGDAVFCGFERSFEEIMKLLDTAIRQTRQLTVDLRNPILYDLGLTAALEHQTGSLAQQHSLSISLTENGTCAELPEAVRVTVYKCVQELLANAIKHSGGKNLGVQVKCADQVLKITVEDDGVGFNSMSLPESSGNRCFGLFSIKERMRYFGGSMEMISIPGKGTSVTLATPFTQIQSRQD